MVDIVGVRFKKTGKIYNFDPSGYELTKDCPVIVETVRGIEYGYAVIPHKKVPLASITQPLKSIIRIATDSDTIVYEENKAKQTYAADVCTKQIARLGLEMQLVDVEITFDRSKIIFYFTAVGRIDFRELVKELAAIFKIRIELRQIGVRDEAKILNGIGICGRTLCCATYLADFQPVSIKMAKEQNLSLNPTKISGICGRLMCCLKYEEDAYDYLSKNMPHVGNIVSTPAGQGEVIDVNILKQLCKVQIQKNKRDVPIVKYFSVSELEIISKVTKDPKVPKELIREHLELMQE